MSNKDVNRIKRKDGRNHKWKTLTPLLILSKIISEAMSNPLSNIKAEAKTVIVNVDVRLRKRLYSVPPNPIVFIFYISALAETSLGKNSRELVEAENRCDVLRAIFHEHAIALPSEVVAQAKATLRGRQVQVAHNITRFKNSKYPLINFSRILFRGRIF